MIKVLILGIGNTKEDLLRYENKKNSNVRYYGLTNDTKIIKEKNNNMLKIFNVDFNDPESFNIMNGYRDFFDQIKFDYSVTKFFNGNCMYKLLELLKKGGKLYYEIKSFSIMCGSSYGELYELYYKTEYNRQLYNYYCKLVTDKRGIMEIYDDNINMMIIESIISFYSKHDIESIELKRGRYPTEGYLINTKWNDYIDDCIFLEIKH